MTLESHTWNQKCVIKENYILPSRKFNAIFSFMLREKVPNFDLSLGTMPLKLLPQLLLFLLARLSSWVLPNMMRKRGGDSWWQSPAICQNLGANYRGCCEGNTEANTLAISNLDAVNATRSLKSTRCGFGSIRHSS